MAALEAELEELRAAVRRRGRGRGLEPARRRVARRDGRRGGAPRRALRERDAAQSLVATTRTELRNITSERDALKKREERRPSDGADAARPADRDALEARLREAVAANAALRRDRRAGRGDVEAPDRALEDEVAALRTRLEALSADARVHGVQLERARAATTDALAQRDATKREADAAVARDCSMKGPSRRPGATRARNRRGSGGRGRRARGRPGRQGVVPRHAQVVLAGDGATSRPTSRVRGDALVRASTSRGAA